MRLDEKSIKFLRSVGSSMNDLYLGFSGGKDSVVIYHLAKLSGIKFTPIYSNTTIDPPGTISFIRNNFGDVSIIHPEESFYDLLKRKGFPSRQTRFCCEILKERAGANKNNIVGVRASESKKREGRDYIQCDNRDWMGSAKHIYPILDWEDDDVWEYIYKHNLPVAPCYSDGCERLGCVGCPLVSPKKRKFEFSIYPRYYDAMKKAIQVGMDNNPQWKLSVATEHDSELAMRFWISNKSLNQYFNDHELYKEDGSWKKRIRQTSLKI